MNFEEMVRAKHAFEDRLNAFVFLIVSMSERQLELALAKLADQKQLALYEDKQANVRLKQANVRLKGELIQACLLAMGRGEIKGSNKFWKMFSKNSKYLPDRKVTGFLGLISEPEDDYAVRCVSEFSLVKFVDVLNQPSFSEQSANQLLRLYGPK